MKLTISFRQLFLYLFFVLLLIECDFFTFTHIFFLSDYYYRNLIVSILSVLMFALCIQNKAIYKRIKNSIKCVKAPIIITGACALVGIIYSAIHLPGGYIILHSLPFASIFQVYPLLYICSDERYYTKLLKGTAIIVSISFAFRTWMTYQYSKNGKILNEELLVPNGGIKLRYGILKIFPTSFGMICAVIILWIALKSRNKIKKIILFALTVLIYLYYALLYSSRIQTLVLTIVLVLMILANGNKLQTKFISSTMVVVVFLYFGMSGVVGNFFKSFSLRAEYGMSTMLRMNGAKYIIREILSHPLGHGYATNFMVDGVKYYPIDYGFLRSLYAFGWLGLVLYVVLFTCLIKLYRSIKGDKVLGLGNMLCFILSGITFDAFMIQTIFSVPLMLAISVKETNKY